MQRYVGVTEQGREARHVVRRPLYGRLAEQVRAALEADDAVRVLLRDLCASVSDAP
jgi:hypothetical protein